MQAEQAKPDTRVLSARVSQAGYQYVEDLADEQDVTVSHMTRRMLMYAAGHMPRDWKPRKEQQDG